MSNTTNTTSTQTQYFPPGVACFTPQGDGFWDPTVYKTNNCSVTPDMIDFLNLTSAISNYISAYCLNPPTDDSCPFGYCPQPDIAGPLVRISTYVTTLCISILVFYSPKRVKGAFYSQLLTMYSLLLTAAISIFQANLTRFHALTVSVIVCSPLSIYFNIYSVRAIWGGRHRLENVLGKGRIFNRILVLLTAPIWLGLTIYAYLPPTTTHFTQESCKNKPLLSNFFLLTPITVAIYVGETIPWLTIVIMLPFVVMAIAWIVAILLRRKAIWPPSQKYRPRFVTVWTVVGDHFPFIHSLTVVALPFLYWMATIELGLIYSNDNKFTLSFGQILAVFVAIQPVVQVAKLAPDWYYWFKDLTWIRRIDGRPKSRRFTSDGSESLLSHSGKERSASMWTIDDTASISSTKYEGSIVEVVEPANTSRGNYIVVDG